MEEVKLIIDGNNITVPGGSTVLEAARSAGIRIPTLCCHERLEPIGSCKMCFVQINGCAEPQQACKTRVQDTMQVTTDSEQLFSMRRESLRELLLRHPLDCPVCDKAGECLLQDLAYEFGVTDVHQHVNATFETFYPTSLIRYWPERCIVCKRCVTACAEIKQLGAIDIKGEGPTAQVYPAKPERCESCGECLQVCPTGALTENLSRYKTRPWLSKRVMTTCTYCGCGCQMQLNVMNNRVVGMTVPNVFGVNKGSLCVKGRFGYEFINSPERLKKPLIRKNGTLQETTWEEALGLVASQFSRIKKEYGRDSIAGISSARCTNEENYLFQKFMRAVIGTNNVDHCARL